MTERNYWQRMRRKQMSRRALLRASGRAGVGAAGLALVGCGDDDDDGQQSAAQAAGQQQQQQQAMQQQGQQQSMQQQAQQQQGEAAAEQQAEQAEQQEQSVADAEEQQAQQVAASDIVRGGNLTFSTPAATHDYFDPGRGVFGPTQFLDGVLHELPHPLPQQGTGHRRARHRLAARNPPTTRPTSSRSIRARASGTSIRPKAVGW